MTDLRLQLEELLAESVDAARCREQSAFDTNLPAHRQPILFGAGNLGRKTLRGLRAAGITPRAFVDNNSAIWGKEIDGVPVWSPVEAAARYGDSVTFIMTIWRGEGTDTMAERCQPLVDLGCRHIINFGQVFWKYPEVFLPHYSFDLPHKVLEQADEVRRAFELWADDASRAEYVAQIRWRLHLDFDGLPRPVKHPIYFPDDLYAIAADERFVDCGAFDGDTLRTFLARAGERFDKVFAFEADPANFAKLRDYVAKLPAGLGDKVEVFDCAVGARDGQVFFDATGTEASAVGASGLAIDCKRLDHVLADRAPTWIKMDIEGSELDAIEGASGLLATSAPILAVCVYHRQDHLWRAPLMIQALRSGYQFFLRPHLLESWDLLCYAVPPTRLQGRRA